MAYKKTNPGDAANIFVRCMLCDLSDIIGAFSEEDLQKTVEFFDYKCPYTGEDIRENYENNSCVLDHLVPQNRTSCGLHVYGNLIPTTASTNQRKAAKNYEEFILRDTEGSAEQKQARIDKIHEFIRQSGYAEKVANIEEIKRVCQAKYDEIKQMLEAQKRQLADIAGVEIREVVQARVPRNNDANVSENEFIEWMIANGISANAAKSYKAALHRILSEAQIGFEEFLNSIIDVAPQYMRGGAKENLGNVYSSAGRAVIKKLLEYNLAINEE